MLNDYLKQHSEAYDFNLIENDDTLPEDIANDGIHLSNEGIYKIARNIIRSINSINNYER